MTVAKRKKRHPHRPAADRQRAPARADEARREELRPDRRVRKEEARRAREAARKRIRRRATLRRAAGGGIVALAALSVFLLVTRVGAPGSVSDTALRAAEAAGCETNEPISPEQQAPGNIHSDTPTSDQLPPTSGAHYGARALDAAGAYDEPVDEVLAVHNLEHGWIGIYYRAGEKNGLPQEVVDRLTTIAEREEDVFLAPTDKLQEETALAFTAWNKLWECPSGVSTDQAATMATSFIEAFRNTSNAPEPNAP